MRCLSENRRITELGEAGFTLFEILVALFILSIVFSSLFASYTGTLKMTREWEDTGQAYSMARGAMDRMLRDLDSAYPNGQSRPFVLEPETVKEKTFPRLSFYTCSRTNPEGSETPAAGISRITYAVREDPDTGGYELARTESSDTGAQSTASDSVICRGLSELTFRFYDRDGQEISETLGSADSSSRPASVVLELTLVNPREGSKPFHFMTRVYPANLASQES
ncbi:MAG: Pseudopilin GspJ [Syntrophus sp. PtaU1.Bin208]|nr:MAG: Pseudopilin GspJ [Syntrophus sp. PtaU1.Bin208]